MLIFLRQVCLVIVGLFLSLTTLHAEEFPTGEVTKHTFDQSKIYPGTVRDYWVYVPQQYDPAKPAPRRGRSPPRRGRP